jgi:hypothetical protein
VPVDADPRVGIILLAGPGVLRGDHAHLGPEGIDQIEPTILVVAEHAARLEQRADVAGVADAVVFRRASEAAERAQ